MKNILFIYILLMYLTAYTQASFNKVYRIDDEQKRACAFGSVVSTDTFCYITGIADIDTSGLVRVGLFISVDSSGNTKNIQTYGKPNKNTEIWHNNLQIISSENFVNTGRDYYAMEEPTVFLLKVRENGETVFAKHYTTPDTTTFMGSLKDFCITNNQYILFCGEYGGLNKTSAVIIIADSTGIEQNRYTYPLFSYQNTATSDIKYIEQDSAYLCAAIVENGDTYSNNLSARTYLFTINEQGQKIWEYLTPLGRNIYCSRILIAENGDFILYGTEVIATYISAGNVDYKQVAYIARMDNNHNLLWEKKYGNPGYTYFSDVIEKDGNFYCLGTTITADSGLSKSWMFKMSENGDSIWSQYYMYPDFYGTYSSHWASQIQPYKDGFVFSGIIHNDLPMSDSRRGYWGWLVRTDSMGNVSPLLNTAITEPVLYEQPDMRVFPNPTNGILNLQLAEALEEEADIVIYTIEGKEMYRSKLRKQSDNTRLYLYHLPQGFYNCVLQIDGNQVYSKPFLKVN